MNDAVKVENLSKSFDVAKGKVEVLKNLTFDIKEGEFIIIFGPSGCGKSTLLHSILGLEPPSAGRVEMFGNDMYADPSGNSVADFRKTNVGMVYQQANWVKALNVLENTALPLVLLGEDRETRIRKAEMELEKVKMLEWAKYHPSELSSGQQQKVSLSRAIITNPRIIITDEPTGNLDFETGNELIGMLKKINEGGTTVIMVTHDLEYLENANRCIKLLNGRIQKIFSPQRETEEMKSVNLKRQLYEEIAKENAKI